MSAPDPGLDGPSPYRLFGEDVVARWLASDPPEWVEMEVWLWMTQLLWQPQVYPAVRRYVMPDVTAWTVRIPGTEVDISYLVWPDSKQVALVEMAGQ